MADYRKKKMIFLSGLFLVVVLFVFSIATDHSHQQMALPRISQVSSFELIDQDERPFGSLQLAGKIFITNFIFTSCPGPCLLLTQKMKHIAQKLEKNDNVHFVSITVDPATDSSAKLKKYGEEHGADFNRWHFLTGKEDLIQSVMVREFKLGHGEDLMMHSNHFVLVDEQGFIRGFYDMAESNGAVKILKDIGALMSAPK